MTPFLHQLRAVFEVEAVIAAGDRRICLTAPTGAGKSFMAALLIRQWQEQGHRVILYTNRRLLVDQLSASLREFDIDHGMRAAGHEEDNAVGVQVASIATENSRVRKKKTWEQFPADRVLVDEAHSQAAGAAQEILEAHVAAGAAIVGLTATPLDLAHLYKRLIVAGTKKELRECGLLVAAHHFGPDEPDMRLLKRLPEDNGGVSENEARKLMGGVSKDGEAGPRLKLLYGRVWKWFERLNPDQRPTILFAPGVAESLWFAQQFDAKGVAAAHIDGENVWVDGEWHRNAAEVRDQVKAASKSGEIKVVCNRFVMREGADWPWLAHGIFATVFGSIQTYLQSGGRLLRAAPGKDGCTIQDHGGNWWKRGSLNADYEWKLGLTNDIVAGLRADGFRKRDQSEPRRCPECASIMNAFRCYECGFEFERGQKQSRPVVTIDGELKEMAGDVFRPRTICKRADAAALWARTYWASIKKPRTFKAAEAAFAWKNNWQWPSHDLPFMPIDEFDWYRLVPEVPRSRLK